MDIRIRHKIFKGFHYGFPFWIPVPRIIGKNFMWSRQKKVRFHADCRYELDKDDMFDVNKLFGYSIGFHHENSARIGWRYNFEHDKIDILLYFYNDGNRHYEKLCEVDFDKDYIISLYLRVDKHDEETIRVDAMVYNLGECYGNYMTYIQRDGVIGYNLPLYFGGNCVAPHTMTIDTTRV